MKFIQYVLPSPFTMGVLLTILTFGFALILRPDQGGSMLDYSEKLLGDWNKGFWELLEFSMQMTLMLLLGHVIAISKRATYLISYLTGFVKNGATAVFVTGFLTILVSLFNWGFGLIFGAILAKQIGKKLHQEGKPFNYPLIAAVGYVGLMVWHGGLSGSATLKAADPGTGNILVKKGIGAIDAGQTIFSSMNLVCSMVVLFAIPLIMYLIAKRQNNVTPEQYHYLFTKPEARSPMDLEKDQVVGAERLDYSRVPAYLLGAVMLFVSLLGMIKSNGGTTGLSFITTNWVNFMLFGLAIIAHGTFHRFIRAGTEALEGTLGIILQFPVYAGIMGIMKYSGMTEQIAGWFVEISNMQTLPVFTLISSGLVNMFVPSGGGQWAVQGEIVVESATQLHVPVAKNIMALCYGDQLTNMLQPFWALPLLGITKLKAKDIFPYTFILFLLGFLIFTTVLILF